VIEETLPPPELVNALRDEAMAEVEAAAVRRLPNFSEDAAAVTLWYLHTHGAVRAEELTVGCHNAGIRPHDDRAFGPVYNRLKREGLIEVVGHARRERGHGTTGGTVYALANGDHGMSETELLAGKALEAAIIKLATLKASIKSLEAQEEALAEDVMAGIFASPTVDHYLIPKVGKMAVQTKDTTTINGAELIAAGVPVDKVMAATHTTTSRPFLRWYPKKEKE
jgi:hypothetical protein